MADGLEHQDLASLSDEYLLAIGRMAANYAMLEEFMQQTIWRILGLNSIEGRVITHRQSFDKMYKTLQTLGREKFKGDTLDIFLKALHSAKSAEKQRSIVTHGWLMNWHGASKAAIIRYKTDNKYVATTHHYNPKDIYNIANRLDASTRALIQTWPLGIPGALPDTPAQP